MRKLDTSMIDDTPGPWPRRTPLVHKVVDRMLPKKQRERCDKHCHCVAEMRVKVNAMFYLLIVCLGYFIPRELYGWMRLRDLSTPPAATSNAERLNPDRVPEPPK